MVESRGYVDTAADLMTSVSNVVTSYWPFKQS